MLSADHHGEHLLIGWRARPLTADVEKDWRFILFLEEFVVVPVPLFVHSLIFLVKVVNLVLEVVCGVVRH